MIDRTGERFGRLVITGKAPGNRKLWFVHCDCRVDKTVLYGNLKTTTSCGCWKAEGKYKKIILVLNLENLLSILYGISTNEMLRREIIFGILQKMNFSI